jgi:ElaB/YqjD/DUF883 family membrane-anchored ribosome-binding protein
VDESNSGIEHLNGHQGEKIYDSARQAIHRTAGEVRRMDRELVALVRERPLASVAVAVAAGYLIGRIFSKFG